MIIAAASVGEWEPAVRVGQVVAAGERVGVLRVLGVATPVIAPADAGGVVTGGKPRGPVGYGDALYEIDPAGAIAAAVTQAEALAGLVFRAPTSGRFYSRAAPGKPPFVAVGDVVKDGVTVCMLEVMKTFNRVVYQGADARVTEVAVGDEADVEAGAVLLHLEAM